jgi:hypothetical protein
MPYFSPHVRFKITYETSQKDAQGMCFDFVYDIFNSRYRYFRGSTHVTRDRKLFADIESKAEVAEKEDADPSIK